MNLINENDERFYLDNSKLPNAGLGVFVKQGFTLKKDDYLEISGVVVKTNSLSDNCTNFARRYKFAANPEGTHKIIPTGYGGMVNHSEIAQNVALTFLPKNRSKRSFDSGQVVYQALRDIFAGEELLGNYGEKANNQIELFKDNIEYFEKEKEEWEKFLKLNLYNLNDIISMLKSMK